MNDLSDIIPGVRGIEVIDFIPLGTRIIFVLLYIRCSFGVVALHSSSF